MKSLILLICGISCLFIGILIKSNNVDIYGFGFLLMTFSIILALHEKQKD